MKKIICILMFVIPQIAVTAYARGEEAEASLASKRDYASQAAPAAAMSAAGNIAAKDLSLYRAHEPTGPPQP